MVCIDKCSLVLCRIPDKIQTPNLNQRAQQRPALVDLDLLSEPRYSSARHQPELACTPYKPAALSCKASVLADVEVWELKATRPVLVVRKQS